jgi:hypothetical protein
MKGVLAVLVFMLGIFVTPVSAQQSGTLTFNGEVFDAPAAQRAGYAQAPAPTRNRPHRELLVTSSGTPPDTSIRKFLRRQ